MGEEHNVPLQAFVGQSHKVAIETLAKQANVSMSELVRSLIETTTTERVIQLRKYMEDKEASVLTAEQLTARILRRERYQRKLAQDGSERKPGETRGRKSKSATVMTARTEQPE